MYVHGGYNTRLYHIWQNMKSRCNTPSTKFYEYYGGRGIKVCDEWNDSFDVFRKWAISHGYKDTLTIDRVNSDGDYCPENCRWATRKEQAATRRSRKATKYYTYEGETLTAKEWSARLGISMCHVRNNFLHTNTPYNKHQLCNIRKDLQHQRSPGV